MIEDIQSDTIEIQKNLLQCWSFFKEEEKFFFYNPVSNISYLGIQKKESILDCPYLLYPLHFFEEASTIFSKKDHQLGIAFEYYWILKGTETIYKTIPSAAQNDSIQKVQHTYTRKTDDYEAWKTLFNTISQAIHNKELIKVVASRKVAFVCESAFHVESILLNLLEKNTESFVFAYHKGGETFLGASPEILVEKHGSHITSHALAGTLIKTEGNTAEQGMRLLHDPKNMHEHRIVRNAIIAALQGVTGSVTIEDTKIMELRNLFHLQTCISTNDEKLTLVEWAKRLHPTPAMGGEPRERALQIIKEHEIHERGMYAAPFGIVEENGDGIFIVGIRSGLIKENTLYAYAGCGIVEQSDCNAEYDEINNKLRTIMECL